MEVKILEVSKVYPPPISPVGMCIPLSFFDLIWLRFPPVEILFSYEDPSLPDTFISRLKHSFSLALQHFLPLSGNFIWPSSAPNPIISYKKGDGVFHADVFLLSIFTVREQYSQLEDIYIYIYINHLLNKDLANPRSLSFMKVESPDGVHGTFEMSASDMKKLKEYVIKHEGINHDLALTTFTVIVAYILVCSVKAKERSDMTFGAVVDCRTRLEPPLSPNYVGNCIGFAGGSVAGDELMGDEGIIAAVNAVQKMRKSLKDGVLKGAEKWFEECETNDYSICIAGSINMEMYGFDFGWGEPKKVDFASIDKTGAVALMQGKDGRGAIQMELSLSKNEMENFASAFAQGLN